MMRKEKIKEQGYFVFIENFLEREKERANGA